MLKKLKSLFATLRHRTAARPDPTPPPAPANTIILIPVSLPAAVPGLIRAAALLLADDPGHLHAIHVRRPPDAPSSKPPDLSPLTAATAEAKKLHLTLHHSSLIHANPGTAITDAARSTRAAWTVIGYHRPVFQASLLGGNVETVLNSSPSHVAIIIDKGLTQVDRVLVPYLGTPQDRGALLAAERLSRKPTTQITLLHILPPGTPPPTDLTAGLPRRDNLLFKHLHSPSPIDTAISESHRFDLLILGLSPAWKLTHQALPTPQETLAQLTPCSIFITRAAEDPIPSPI